MTHATVNEAAWERKLEHLRVLFSRVGLCEDDSEAESLTALTMTEWMVENLTVREIVRACCELLREADTYSKELTTTLLVRNMSNLDRFVMCFAEEHKACVDSTSCGRVHPLGLEMEGLAMFILRGGDGRGRYREEEMEETE